jgi:hypothetical protein
VIQLVGLVGVVVGPGPDLRMVGGQVGDSVRVGPVVGIQVVGLGGQLAVV